MSRPTPTFRVMKNGYDRFAVDEAIERYACEIDVLEQKLAAYELQYQQHVKELQQTKLAYMDLEKSYDAREKTAEEITRASLREANAIISTAQKNADLIIHEALLTARLILSDVSRLYSDADTVKQETAKQLEDLLRRLEEFQVPQLPDLKWLEEAENKMR